MGVWVGSARRWLASGMGVCPRRQECAATIPYPPRDRKPAPSRPPPPWCRPDGRRRPATRQLAAPPAAARGTRVRARLRRRELPSTAAREPMSWRSRKTSWQAALRGRQTGPARPSRAAQAGIVLVLGSLADGAAASAGLYGLGAPRHHRRPLPPSGPCAQLGGRRGRGGGRTGRLRRSERPVDRHGGAVAASRRAQQPSAGRRAAGAVTPRRGHGGASARGRGGGWRAARPP